ncbi:lamin tail domain-containing protein [Candidatus Poribacteria bacterium]|nr:lamin tail domain-containing protein [Candidatus Poribacteria bacterium]
MMLLSNRLTYCITTFILLLAFAALPAMAHVVDGAVTDFALLHDGIDNDNADNADPAETDHSHYATAPMVSSITAEDTMGQVAPASTGGTLVSNVDGMNIVLVSSLTADNDTRIVIALADADTTDTTPDTLDAGSFQLKITFDRDVYPVAQAGTAAEAAPTIAANTGVFTGVSFVAAAADVAGVNIGSFFEVGTLTRVQTAGADTDTDTADDEYSAREFLVPVTINATNARTLTEMRLPVSLWVTVAENQVYSLTQLVGPNIMQGRGNAEFQTPNPFSLNGYVAPVIPPTPPPPDPSETDAPTVMISAPARVMTPGSTANLAFTLTFNEGITGLLENHLMIEGGTFVSATAGTVATADALQVWTVMVDPTGDPAETEVTVTLLDGSVADLEGNLYRSPTAGPDMARYDTVNPTVMATAGGPAAPVAPGAVTLTITFSEALGTGDAAFANADIDRTNSNVLLTSTEPMMAATQPEDGTQVWELTVTPVPANAGQVVIVIKESSVADMVGNELEQDTIVTWTRPSVIPPTADTTKPVVMLQDPKGPDSASDMEGPADDVVIDDSGGSITFTISDEGGSGLAAGAAVAMNEVSVSNGSVVSVSGNQITVNPMIADGANVNTTVTVTVAAGAIADAAGNMNDAVSATYSIGPIFAIPANTILVITKTAGLTSQYLSDQPRLPLNQNPPTPAEDIATEVWSNMPDLEVLFSFAAGGNGGTISLIEANRQAELGQSRDGGNGQHQSVRISEVMWASDLSMRGATNDEEAAEQWIEVSNHTGSAVRVLLYARTGLDSAINIDNDAEDRVGNAYNGGRGSAGWTVPGQNGNSYTGVDFKSMHRKWDGAHNRGYVNGTSSGNWSASDREYLTVATRNPNDGDLYNYVGSPGRRHSIGLPRPSTRAGTTNVPSSPVIINEVANRSDGDRQYEWIELRNVTGNEVNLRNWMISVVRATDDDKPMIQFPNNDNAKIAPNGVILLLASDPRYDDDHPIAVGYNVDVNANDQVDGLGLNVPGSTRQPPRQKVITFENGGLPDGGDYVLILRKHDNYEGHRANQHGGKGVAETGGADIDKIIDVAGSHRGLDKSNYPPTNPAGLNSTTLWPLVNFSGHNRPHYGHGDLNHRRHNRLDVNRVRYRQHVKTSARNDADGSDGVNRAGTGVTHKNEEVGHYAFRDAIYTGLGYKRTARAPGIHNGTPGYNGNSVGNTGIVKATADKVSVTISEIMPATGPNADNPVYPQWIELFNSSPTDAVNLRNWKLRFEMLDADGNPMNLMDLGFNSSRSVKTIQPQQTVLIVAGNARQANSDSATGIDVFNENRVFNVYRDVGAGKFGANTRYMFFNPTAFSIALLDKDNKVVDHIGNLDGDNRTSDTNAWDFPMGVAADNNRTSFIRIYDDGVARTGLNTSESNVMPIFKEGGKRNDTDGIDMKYSWIPAVNTEREFKVTIKSTWYGDEDDYGTPGHRVGLVLPVELSSFRPTLEDGVVTIRWTTESELDNAGFNIYRSDARDGEFKQVNSDLIEGAGTTGERSTYSWVDQTAKPGVIYYYQIEDVSFAGDRQPLAITKLKGLISAKNKLTTTWSELKEASQ